MSDCYVYKKSCTRSWFWVRTFQWISFRSISAVDEQNGLHVGHQGHPAHPQSPSKSAIVPSSLPIPQICIPEPSDEPIPSTSSSGIPFTLINYLTDERWSREGYMSDRMFGEWDVHHTCTCVKVIFECLKKNVKIVTWVNLDVLMFVALCTRVLVVTSRKCSLHW